MAQLAQVHACRADPEKSILAFMFNSHVRESSFVHINHLESNVTISPSKGFSMMVLDEGEVFQISID